MNLSRKDFFKKSLFSLGETVGTAVGVLKVSPAVDVPPEEPEDFVPNERQEMCAVADNRNCLAKNCGCFSCIERCEVQAIRVVMGEGIRIDETLCTGCGTCEYVCPVRPKAITVVRRWDR